MADKAANPKAKPKRSQRSVLGTLPANRPERIGGPRTTASGATAQAGAKTRGVKPAAKKRAPAKKPAAIRPGSPPLRAHRAGEAPPPRPLGAPKGTELLTTTIRAAGELAQVGLTVGGLLLKRTIDRIPRP